jgi:hypothetical protein
VNTDSRKRWGAGLWAGGSRDGSGGWNGELGSSARLQPLTQLQASIAAEYRFGSDAAQWIQNQDRDDGTTDHVYGRLTRDVLNITARATYAFERDLTLEAYLQPFVAVGDYTDIRKLTRPRSFDFEPTSITEDPDFNRKSLRGTFVLRWEYVRGSTLFVVWNLSSLDETRPGVFSTLRDLGGAFGASGTNTLAVKVTYWFAP